MSEKDRRGGEEEEEMGKESAKESRAQHDSWKVWKKKSGVMAKRPTRKANQQLVAPYVTLKGRLLSVDFRDHALLAADV